MQSLSDGLRRCRSKGEMICRASYSSSISKRTVSMKLPMIFVKEVVLVDGFTEAVASELRIAAS